MSPYVFIVGAPRSGTTLLLNLLRDHPDVVHVDRERLGLPVKSSTFETGVLAPVRRWSDERLADTFARIARENPGCRLVEKTPGHVFHLERARRVLSATIVCLIRHPLDVACSILTIGRREDSWWKSAPSTADEVATFLEPFLEATEAALRSGAIAVHYERLFSDPGTVLGALLPRLQLSTTRISSQVAFALDRAHLPFDAVWQRGDPGRWEVDLTAVEREVLVGKLGKAMDRLGYG